MARDGMVGVKTTLDTLSGLQVARVAHRLMERNHKGLVVTAAGAWKARRVHVYALLTGHGVVPSVLIEAIHTEWSEAPKDFRERVLQEVERIRVRG